MQEHPLSDAAGSDARAEITIEALGKTKLKCCTPWRN